MDHDHHHDHHDHHLARLAAAANESIGFPRRCGQILLEAKSRLGHGKFLPWLAANFNGSGRTARDYMRIAKNRNDAAAQRSPSIRGKLAALRTAKAEPPPFPIPDKGGLLVAFESGAARVCHLTVTPRPGDPELCRVAWCHRLGVKTVVQVELSPVRRENVWPVLLHHLPGVPWREAYVERLDTKKHPRLLELIPRREPTHSWNGMMELLQEGDTLWNPPYAGAPRI